MPHSLPSRLRLWVSEPGFAGRVFWVVVAVAAFLRFRWLNQVQTQPVTDFAWYFDRASEMARGMDYQVGGKATAYWPVGYPGFLSLLFRVTGPSVDAARLANAFLSTAVVLLSGMTVLRMTPNRWVAVAVMAILAWHPAWIAYGGILASEPLYTTLTLLGLWQFPHDRKGNAVVSGLAFGLASLVRPQAILIPVVLLGLRLFLPPSRQGRDIVRRSLGGGGRGVPLSVRLRSTSPNLSFKGEGIVLVPLARQGETQIRPSFGGGGRGVPLSAWLRSTSPNLSFKGEEIALCFLLICALAPPMAWSARNINAVGGFAFVSTNGGDNLWIGATGEGRYITPKAFSQNEIEQDKLARQEATKIIKENPAKWLRRAPEKLRQTFMSGSDAPYWAFQIEPGELITPGEGNDKEQFKAFREKSNAWPPALVAFAILGIFIRPRQDENRVNLTFAVVIIGLTALLSVVFFGNPRFGLPTTPFLALLAVLPFVRMAESLAKTSPKQDGGSQNDGQSPTIS